MTEYELVLARNDVRELIEYLSSTIEAALPIRGKFFATLDHCRLRTAHLLNRVYSGYVWGTFDCADNQTLCSDEEHVLERWLVANGFGGNVLEVGCGSGRVSRYAASLCALYTAVDCEAAAIERAISIEPIVPSCRYVCANVLEFQPDSAFSAILLVENVLGMIPERSMRLKILRRVRGLADRAGVMIFAFRVVEVDSLDKCSVQVMPFSTAELDRRGIRLFGIANVWTPDDFLGEIIEAIPDFSPVEIFEGLSRPAGGKMYFVTLMHRDAHLYASN